MNAAREHILCSSFYFKSTRISTSFTCSIFGTSFFNFYSVIFCPKIISCSFKDSFASVSSFSITFREKLDLSFLIVIKSSDILMFKPACSSIGMVVNLILLSVLVSVTISMGFSFHKTCNKISILKVYLMTYQPYAVYQLQGTSILWSFILLLNFYLSSCRA